METENPQFDSFLGGSQAIPNGQNLSEFIKWRMEEVVMLTEAIEESPFRGQAFQRLPKHMRRRQMSHYIKRLPRRLQRPYLMSLKDGLPAPTKRPSRKYRRKPSNLLLEYNRRQKTSTWLETHIWHAKRFHMCTKWGYKLPQKPVNKSFKACYRAILDHCLLLDHSYYNCIELEGPESELCNGLKQCTSPECGLSFCAKMYLSGKREGWTTLFHPNSYPYHVIGDVTFMWQPSGINTRRKIWIWVHPLMYNEVIECFKLLFNLSLVPFQNGDVPVVVEERVPEKRGVKKSKKKLEVIKLEPKNVPFDRTPKYTNESVTMTSLKDTLNRFQLTGPLSHAIVSQAFTVASVSEECPEIEVLEVESKRRRTEVEVVDEEPEVVIEDEKQKNWWTEYYGDRRRRNSWSGQKDFYRMMSTWCRPSDVPPGMILGLVIEDPRLKIPSKREKATPTGAGASQMAVEVDDDLCQSPIWIPEIRDEVSLRKFTTQEINEARSRNIVPGRDLGNAIPNEYQSRIPVLLVQRPGRGDSGQGKLGLGSGWDIIAPAGFGMPIWLALVFRGARTGGLRESKLLQLECNSLRCYPPPDSTAGEADNQDSLENLREKYFKLPPGKRPNFRKLGVLSPFYPSWSVLVRDWIKKTSSETYKTEMDKVKFCVLRDIRTLRRLQEVINSLPKQASNHEILNLPPNSLIPVIVDCCGKGKPTDLAVICLPETKDLDDLLKPPKEPLHVDENEQLRKTLKFDHSKLLKSLRRKRKKEKAKKREELASGLPGEHKDKNSNTTTSVSEPHSREYNAKMRELWLPDTAGLKSIVDSCSRTIVGFIVLGEFSYSRSNGAGLGYVTVGGLLRVLEVCQKGKSKAIVLVRNRDEVQYRFCKMKIATGS